MRWDANWIWLERRGDCKNQYVDFRKVIHLEPSELAQQPVLHLSARLEYNLWINGQWVGRGPSPCTPDYQYYDSYEVGRYLQAGDNVISVLCYQFGESNIITNQMQGEAGFIAQLMVEGADAAATVISATDHSWKSRLSPRFRTTNERLSLWGGFKEIYLAQQDDDWQQLHYKVLNSAWADSQELAQACDPNSPWPRLIAREIPFLATEACQASAIIRTELNLGSITEPESLLTASADSQAESHSTTVLEADASRPGSMPAVVYDFGRIVVGRPILEVDAPEGGVVRIAYGESLELQEVDTFVLKQGCQRLQPFGRRVFQYLKLTFMATPVPVAVTSLSCEKVGYPFTRQTQFGSSDDLLNRIHEVSLYTTRMNSHDHTEDCPWREKALWVVDSMVMGKIIYANFADTALLRKCLLQGARIQLADGSIPGTGPEDNGMLLPDFCAYWLIGLHDYWRYSGDSALLAELEPATDRLIDWFRQQSDDTGLFARADRTGYWCFIDWSDDIDRRDKVAAISFLRYKALKVYSDIMRELDPTSGKAEQAEAEAVNLVETIRTHLWVGEKGLFADCLDGDAISDNYSLQTNFMAAWCGIMTEEETNRFLDDYYFANQLPPVRGPFFQHIVLEVLRNVGRREEALSLIRSYWGEMLSRGATTWWETFDAEMPACTIPSTYQGHTPTYLQEGIPVSACHGWGASPAYLLNELVLGVDLSDLGSGIIHLRSPYDGVESAEAVMPLPGGQSITIKWKTGPDGLTGTAEVPSNYRIDAAANYPLRIIPQEETEHSVA
ncbi:family 78 glycoside hydrolase catalytic domain [Paenibacillus sp. CF384]|uniref:family 78 glycoside hydrolase catalytic domain n=1 Tax=Paenibacillus sp. CF384 TaxID=1884382 RepID=UPI000899F7B0|nr:family 78 glycoside hydrolase catalytic domain [Paenibacillus sp. CF384]SDX21048.1 Alpha-L-rhamnosidase N-terminal domain-containing protein [Paenibacillus sp. CF384]